MNKSLLLSALLLSAGSVMASDVSSAMIHAAQEVINAKEVAEAVKTVTELVKPVMTWSVPRLDWDNMDTFRRGCEQQENDSKKLWDAAHCLGITTWEELHARFASDIKLPEYLRTDYLEKMLDEMDAMFYRLIKVAGGMFIAGFATTLVATNFDSIKNATKSACNKIKNNKVVTALAALVPAAYIYGRNKGAIDTTLGEYVTLDNYAMSVFALACGMLGTGVAMAYNENTTKMQE